MVSLGQTLKTRRKNLGLTQHDVARRARLPRSEISEMENGRYTGSIVRIERVADALGLALSLHVKKRPVFEELREFFSEDD